MKPSQRQRTLAERGGLEHQAIAQDNYLCLRLPRNDGRSDGDQGMLQRSRNVQAAVGHHLASECRNEVDGFEQRPLDVR